MVGLDGDDDGGDVSVAASCDDYDINPEGGIGFSAAYQRSRGRDVPEMGAVAASTARTEDRVGKNMADATEAEVNANAVRLTTFSQRGRGRRLADM